MKTNFITSLVKYFIEKEYFNLIVSEKIEFNADPISLIKDFNGITILLEIFDADKYEVDQLTQIMENGKAMISSLNGRSASLFMLFLFKEDLDKDKIKIIESEQLDIPHERKFMKCMSLNISGKKLHKHFSYPKFDANISKTIKRFFSKKLDIRETSVQDVEALIEKRKKDFEIQFKAKTPWVSYILIALNVAVYLILSYISKTTDVSYDELLISYGAKVNFYILKGEYWRFITPMFLHSGFQHIFLNSYSLLMVGPHVEKIFGHVRFVIIYFISGILGCIASFAFSSAIGVGASGAIFGIFGAMLFFAIKRPALLKSGYGASLISTLIINITYGLMNKQIDNFAHLGGLLGGFITTNVVYPSKERILKDKLAKLSALIIAIILAIGGLVYGFNNNYNSALKKIVELELYKEQGNIDKIEKKSEEILSMDISDNSINLSSVYLGLIQAEAENKKYVEAIEHSKQLIKLSPVDGHFALGCIYFDTGEYEKAAEELRASQKISSKYAESIEKLLKMIK